MYNFFDLDDYRREESLDAPMVTGKKASSFFGLRVFYNACMDKFTVFKVYVFRALTWFAFLNLLTFIKVYEADISGFLQLDGVLLYLVILPVVLVGMFVFSFWDYRFGTGQRENTVNTQLNPMFMDMYSTLKKMDERLKNLEK